MSQPAVVALAILKVNWDREKKDYIDIFVPFVAECLRTGSDSVVSTQNLQECIKNKFGLNIPQKVVETIIGRAKRHGYIRYDRKNRVLRPVRKRLSKLTFQKTQREVIEQHEAVLRDFIDYAKKNYSQDWTEKKAESTLISFFEENQLVVIASQNQGTLIPDFDYPGKSAKYIVGAYVYHLQRSDSSKINHLVNVVKGNMLANSVFLPDPTKANKRFRRTKVFFDTPFLIWSLGFSGDTRRAPCIELLDLLYETGAELRCFNHTVLEIKGILNACASILDQGTKPTSGPIVPTIEYFLSAGYSGSDIHLISATLERKLEALRIKVEDRPAYEHAFVIDELELKSRLESAMSTQSAQALDRDVDSIAAIMRIRKGMLTSFVEDCKAIFITSNTTLARTSSTYYYEYNSEETVASTLTDYTLTNLLWLKRPLSAPDLPKKRIIADFFAATQPSEELWSCYLQEAEKLERVGDITAEDYYLLRYSLDAKQELMRKTLGEEGAFTNGTVPEILAYVHNQVKSELVDEVTTKDLKLQEAEKREREIQDNIRFRAVRWAGITSKMR